MARIAIFASGNGSNFECLAESFKSDEVNKVVLLVCDKEKAFVIERAKKFGTKVALVKYIKDDRLGSEKKIVDIINENKIDIIFLAGYMRILSPFFINELIMPIINIHPSLLPKHKGAHAIQDAFNAGDEEIGISIHYVNEEVDAGQIIIQKKIPLIKERGIDFVEQEVHKLEHQWYPKVAKELCDEINKLNLGK